MSGVRPVCVLTTLRARAGGALFARVAGPEGPRNRELIHCAPGPRWFAAERPIRRVHGDGAMFVGGLAALLLQSLHPLAMAAVDAHSGYRGDPWGRLQRTSTFLATTTYGPADSAQAACERVRSVHAGVHGHTPDGVPYRASDPHLLLWVHTAEVACFLLAHQTFGARPLNAAGCDGYVADAARVARALGVPDPPMSYREVRALLGRFRPELRGTPAARDTARFLLLRPPLPVAALPFYGALAVNAVALLPRWATAELRIPRLGRSAERLLVRPVGGGCTRVIRWAMAGAPPPAAAAAAAAAATATATATATT
ncbi:oxygenase MpaB family protein [Streptomyces sp. B-S-A8]|uniref:Oxygenase MpaB family protein n=1 Tax=Streptomyces solicavernae TaxID=3043614 RepID=A0ABT6RTM2_9ACTN|nr:oxygenase MpaB family protein [Streptomyces sp. B-S-A8]MDI3387781.1 oxygenase MpaB family protein [Streptomyces sp. B-S-A8]